MAAAFIINFAVSQIVTRVFADNPEKQQDMGVRQQVPPSSVNAIPIVYGDASMGGTFVDAVLTTDQKTMYYVLAISSISSANSALGTSAGVFNYDMSNMYYGDRLISFSSSGTVQSIRVFNGGTGYAVGNVLTVSGGTFSTAATATVASVTSGGVIDTVTVTNAGNYTAAPNNPALVTGGAGTGASLVLKFSVYTNTVTALCDEAGNVDTKINTNLYINLYKSSSAGVITPVNGTDLPSTVMGGSDIAVAQRWTGTRQMNNLAFAIVKLVYNRDADTTQLNPITFNVSHYPNGASVAKPGDVWLDYITNQDYGGAVGWLPDGSFSAAFVDTTCVAPLNTYSDATITYTPSGGGSATQARYRINGVLDAGQSVLSNLDRIMSACDSWMTYNAALGQWSVVINKAETTAYAFTDNNIVGDIRVSATDITSSINQVEARFPFKSNRDQAAFVNLETPYALLYPNEPVNKYSITYDLVNDSVQASYLANRLLEQAREDLIVSFSTTYYGIQVDAGTVVSVTNADYGWNAKLFRVMKVNEASLPDGSLGAKLELNEYNAQVYDDATIQQFTPAPNSGLPSVSYFSPLSAPTVTGFPLATIPYINVQVFIPTTGRVTFGSLFWTTSATPTPADWKLVTTAATTNNQPVTNGTYYTFSNITLNTGTYYFAYNVGNDITTSILSPISSALVWNPVAGSGPTGATGPAGPTVDISNFTGFTKSITGVITPTSQTLTAVTTNVISPVYAWTVTGATPSSGSSSTITITPTSGATTVVVSLSVTGTGITTPIVKAITMPIVLDGATGATGGSGAIGLAAITAYKVQFQSTAQPTFTTPTSGSAAPTGWDLTLSAAITSAGLTTLLPGYVVWYIYGQYNANTATSGGVPASSTAWTGPIAASVFQDIRSDNWNGSNPPTLDPNTPSTWGTTGYYIQQSTGYMFLNSVYGRGQAKFNGSFTSTTYTTAIEANSSLSSASGLTAYSTTVFTLGGAVRAYNSSTTGGGNAIYGNHSAANGGVAILGLNSGTTGYGVYGNGPTGIYGAGNIGVLGVAFYASGNIAGQFSNQYPSGIAVDIPNGTLRYGGITIAVPPNTTTTWLRGDGTWTTVDAAYLGGVVASSWARIFVGDTGTANAAGSGMNFNCTISGYQFAGSGNTLTLQPISDKRLKENIEPETLGLDFVNALKPVTYNMIGQQRKAHGFIAQDIEALIAGANDSLKIENADGMKGVDYMSLIAPLVKAVQELTKRIQELEKI
jgi:hypothetical protein